MRLSTLLILAAYCASGFGSGDVDMRNEKTSKKRKVSEISNEGEQGTQQGARKIFKVPRGAGSVRSAGEQKLGDNQFYLYLTDNFENGDDFHGKSEGDDIFDDASKHLAKLIYQVDRIAKESSKSCDKENDTEQILGVTIPKEEGLSSSRAMYRGHLMQLQRYSEHLLKMLYQIRDECKATEQSAATVTTTTTAGEF